MIYYGVLLNIGHYLLMVRKGISPAPNSTVSAEASNHVTTRVHERSLAHYLIAETYDNGRFHR